jgi:hypothetical protein
VSRLFLPQQVLEEWIASGKADIQEGQLAVFEEKARFPVQPAVHFTQLVSGTDEHRLLARVKTQAQMEALKAEQVMDSVLVGDAAYEVVVGYLAEVEAQTNGETPPRRSETDLLAAFLLDKLTP